MGGILPTLKWTGTRRALEWVQAAELWPKNSGHTHTHTFVPTSSHTQTRKWQGRVDQPPKLSQVPRGKLLIRSGSVQITKSSCLSLRTCLCSRLNCTNHCKHVWRKVMSRKDDSTETVPWSPVLSVCLCSSSQDRNRQVWLLFTQTVNKVFLFRFFHFISQTEPTASCC